MKYVLLFCIFLFVTCVSAYPFDVYIDEENKTCGYVGVNQRQWLESKNLSWQIQRTNLSETWTQQYDTIPDAVQPYCENLGYRYIDDVGSYARRHQIPRPYRVTYTNVPS